MQSFNTSLTQQLLAFKAGLMARVPEKEREVIRAAAEDLRAGALVRKVPGPGEAPPHFTLPDQHGRRVSLSERLAHGPVVLLFVRGGWCPFCTLTLRAYQRALPSIQALGADLLAVTPHPADTTCLVAERDLLAFPMLSDHDNVVSEQYGVAYDLAEPVRKLYLRLGHDLPKLNHIDNWRVPLPATFIIGGDGRIVRADVQPAAHLRLEPSEAVATLQSLHALA